VKVLLTGASSFTGFWFAWSLSQRGIEVVAPIRGRIEEYNDTRGIRVRRLQTCARVVEGVSFGDEGFLSLIEQERFDVLCHHAAHVTNYRSADFDVGRAFAENTLNLRQVLDRLSKQKLKAVVATGSVFEHDEGIGDTPLRAFSPYGLSKGLTWQAIRYWSNVFGIPTGKFVISNPFGAFEEPRFCAYLVSKWSAHETAEVRTPLYLRDNIHVDLLALAYANFVVDIANLGRSARIAVSGYRETQGAFAGRFALEMRARLGLECQLVLAEQTDFSEPLVRLNNDRVDALALGWQEAKAWDALGEYYQRRLKTRF